MEKLQSSVVLQLSPSAKPENFLRSNNVCQTNCFLVDSVGLYCSFGSYISKCRVSQLILLLNIVCCVDSYSIKHSYCRCDRKFKFLCRINLLSYRSSIFKTELTFRKCQIILKMALFNLAITEKDYVNLAC